MADVIKKLDVISNHILKIGLKSLQTTLTVDGTSLLIDKNLRVNVINENTTDAGVTVEGVLVKDGIITGATIDADDNTIKDLVVGNLKAGVLDTDLSSVSANDDTLPSAKAVKSYVDGAITAANHTQNTDTGTTSQTFTVDSDGASPIKIKNNAGVVELRNSADSGFVDLQVNNLTVRGSQTIIDSTDVAIADNVMILNKDEVSDHVSLGEAGIEIERGTGTNYRIIFDDSDDKFKVGFLGSETAVSLEGHTHTSTSITDFAEAAQDAVGGILTDSNTIDFTYDDANNTITAIVKDDSIDKTKIAADVAGNGLGQNADGSLEVKTDNTTIEIDTDALRIKDGGVSAAKIGANAVTAAKLNSDVAGAGLGLNLTTNAIDVNVGDGIQISSDAVTVKLDGSTLSVGANGLKVTDNTFQPLDATLTALAGLDTTGGIVVQTGTDTFTKRTITGTANRISVTNGDGISGAPTIDIGSKVLTDDSTHTLTNKTFDAEGTGNSLSNITVSNLKSGVLDTDLSSVAADDTTIPSAKAVKSQLDLKTDIATTVRKVKVPFAYTDGNVDSTVSIPSGAIVEKVQMKISTAFDDVAATVAINVNGSTPLALMGTDESDVSVAGTYVSDLLSDIGSSNTGKVRVVVTPGSAAQGAGYVIVTYSEGFLA